MNPPTYGFVLLAAGASSRMGQPKALLPYNGTTMIGHIIAQMQACGSWPVLTVTGAELLLLPEIATVQNNQWHEGMASSIRLGVATLMNMAAPENIILAVCDQPAIRTAHFLAIMKKKTSGNKGIIASAYAKTVGTPVLFDKKYIPDLLNLNGQSGAKTLLQTYLDDIETVDFPSGEIDIDTIKDYHSLIAECPM